MLSRWYLNFKIKLAQQIATNTAGLNITNLQNAQLGYLFNKRNLSWVFTQMTDDELNSLLENRCEKPQDIQKFSLDKYWKFGQSICVFFSHEHIETVRQIEFYISP